MSSYRTVTLRFAITDEDEARDFEECKQLLESNDFNFKVSDE